ncbi:unnamed protein product [Symbiodinium sp. CCMP2456]|nr:unnamed protein product [Symbiodinium sp. CCMP2456]
MARLNRRIQNLGPNAPRQNFVYMRFRLARQNAAYLAARFIQEACERVGVAHGLVLNRNLLLNSGEGTLEYVPGISPQKTEKAKRLSRHYIASKKSLLKDLSEKILQFVEDDWGILNSFQGLPDSGPVLTPPGVKGMSEKWLFGMLEIGVFRRQVAAVTKCTTTDIRAASEDHLIGDASLVGNLRNSRNLQNFVNHSPGISLKHYQVTDSSQLNGKLGKLMAEKP